MWLKVNCYQHKINYLCGGGGGVYTCIPHGHEEKFMVDIWSKENKTKEHHYRNHQLTEVCKKERKGNRTTRHQKTINKTTVSPYLSPIAINVHGLNSPINKYRVTGWI